MNTKLPPVPKENRSRKGDSRQPNVPLKSDHPNPKRNFDKQGQQANTKINTTHQGLRQDR